VLTQFPTAHVIDLHAQIETGEQINHGEENPKVEIPLEDSDHPQQNRHGEDSERGASGRVYVRVAILVEFHHAQDGHDVHEAGV
jgi:hypothetical protein